MGGNHHLALPGLPPSSTLPIPTLSGHLRSLIVQVSSFVGHFVFIGILLKLLGMLIPFLLDANGKLAASEVGLFLVLAEVPHGNLALFRPIGCNRLSKAGERSGCLPQKLVAAFTLRVGRSENRPLSLSTSTSTSRFCSTIACQKPGSRIV